MFFWDTVYNLFLLLLLLVRHTAEFAVEDNEVDKIFTFHAVHAVSRWFLDI